MLKRLVKFKHSTIVEQNLGKVNKMFETEYTSEINENENISSNYEDDQKLLKKKKILNFSKKNRQKPLNEKSNYERNVNEINSLPKLYDICESNAVNTNAFDADQNTTANKVNSRNEDVNLIEAEVVEEFETCRCDCFVKMFTYLKRKLFKNGSSPPDAKRVKQNDNITDSNVTSSTTQSSNLIDSERFSGFLVHKSTEPKLQPLPANHEGHSSQFVENGERIDSNEADAPQQTQQAQKRKRIRKKKLPKVSNSDIELPEEIRNNPALKKYWNNRYRLFSKYDKGIKLDAESWYSVTPEKISKNIARRCQCDVIVDAFCGAGGNTIQFAFTCERVIAIDIDPGKIELAKHNAQIYGVADRIEFIVGDFFQIAPSLVADVVFLSPPWGGPSYKQVQDLQLNQIIEPYGGQHLYNVAKQISEHISYFLPRNINIMEIAALEPDDYVKIDRNYLDDRVVAITAYFGDLVEDYGDDWNY